MEFFFFWLLKMPFLFFYGLWHFWWEVDSYSYPLISYISKPISYFIFSPFIIFFLCLVFNSLTLMCLLVFVYTCVSMYLSCLGFLKPQALKKNVEHFKKNGFILLIKLINPLYFHVLTPFLFWELQLYIFNEDMLISLKYFSSPYYSQDSLYCPVLRLIDSI